MASGGGAVPGRPACCYFLIAMDTATSSWSRSQASPRVTLTLYGAPTGFQVRLSWAQGPKAPSPLLGSVKQGDWQCLPLTTADKRQVLREARGGKLKPSGRGQISRAQSSTMCLLNTYFVPSLCSGLARGCSHRPDPSPSPEGQVRLGEVLP